MFVPVRTCTSCSGAGVTTCSSSGAATSCGAVGNTQYYLRNSLCVLICPGGTWGSVSGNSLSNSSYDLYIMLHPDFARQRVPVRRAVLESRSAKDQRRTNGMLMAFSF